LQTSRQIEVKKMPHRYLVAAALLLVPLLVWAHGESETATLEVGGGAITVTYKPPQWGPTTFGMIQRGEGEYAGEFIKDFAAIELPAAYRLGGSELAAGKYQLTFRSEAGKMSLRLRQEGQTRAEVPIALQAAQPEAALLTIELKQASNRAVQLVLLYGPHRAEFTLERV
jgi:hypothetical protein